MHLRVTGKELKSGDVVTVEQVSVDRVRLGASEKIVYRAEDAPPPKTWGQKYGWTVPVCLFVLFGATELTVAIVKRKKKQKL